MCLVGQGCDFTGGGSGQVFMLVHAAGRPGGVCVNFSEEVSCRACVTDDDMLHFCKLLVVRREEERLQRRGDTTASGCLGTS